MIAEAMREAAYGRKDEGYWGKTRDEGHIRVTLFS